MAEFEQAITFVLANEGGLVSDPKDPGGLTKFGISQRSYPKLDVRNLSLDDAIAIYKRDFWKFDGIQSQRAATKVLDMCVDFGPTGGIQELQRALGWLQAGPVIADGRYGPITEAHVNAADETQLLDELKAQSVMRYAEQNNPHDFAGWIRRAVKG